ncbi:MAG: 4Fe-4S ferredoxin [Candidatus Heimdallarchaeota archaeon]|nr:4Fe-4S ferredoxin [Candidatus Heimdallarchaeota archaeon]
MTRPRWFIELLKKSFGSRFILAKLTRVPGFKQIIDSLLFKDDMIFYLPNKEAIEKSATKSIQIGKTIPQQDDIIIPTQIIDKFIEEAEHLWVMNFCLCRESTQCENYSSKLGCLFMGEAVLQIDPSYGKLVSKVEAKEHIKRCQEAGLIQLIGRNKLDKQWLDVKPGHKLLTVCNCCECCCLWKMLPDLNVKISRNFAKMPGLNVKINDKCIGCEDCTQDICFVNAIALHEGKAVINEDICRACGRCISICKQEAIQMIIQEPDFINETIRRISSAVDVN